MPQVFKQILSFFSYHHHNWAPKNLTEDKDKTINIGNLALVYFGQFWGLSTV